MWSLLRMSKNGFLQLSSIVVNIPSSTPCKRWISLCLVSAGLFLLIGYHHHSVGLRNDSGRPDPSITYHKTRKERLDRVCREWNGVKERVPAMFVIPVDRYLPFPYSATLINNDGNAHEIPITSHFHLASAYQTMGCFVNKIASSSFVSAFLKIQGFTESLQVDPYQAHDKAHLLLPKSLEEFQLANSTFFKFMFVRHPMDRMLSAYLDKMVSKPEKNYLLPYRSCIKERGAKVILNRRMNNKTSSFPHDPLPNCTLQEANRLASSFQNDNNSSIIPTFEEFLEFVLSTDLHGLSGYEDAAHSHWVPFHRYCSPCSINFDVVGKLETAANDFEYIWNKSGLIRSGVTVPRLNGKVAAANRQSKNELEKRHYSSLPRELILRFYEIFRMDFKLFDYSIDDILLKAGYPPLPGDSSSY